MQIKGNLFGNSTEYVAIYVLKSDKKNESLLKRQKQKKRTKKKERK